MEDLTGNERGGIGEQERGELGDVVWISDILERMTFFGRLTFRLVSEKRQGEGSIGE